MTHTHEDRTVKGALPGATCFLRNIALGAIFAGCSLATVSASAAEDSGTAQSGQIEEVVVTARYKTETAQSVPISITALGADQLRSRNVSNVSDLAEVIPSVSMLPGTSDQALVLQTYIRGIGQSYGNPGYSPGVGTYIDGVYFDSVFASALALLDIDRLEVLRGPQGTLFGKNTAGGAIRLFTPKPTGNDTGYVEITGGNQGQRELRGVADFAVVPSQLFVRVSAAQKHINDYMQVIDYSCANPGTAGTLPATTRSAGCGIGGLGAEDVTQGRLAVRWLPTDTLDINFSVSRLYDDSDGVPNKTLAIDPTAPQLAAFNQLVTAAYGIPIDGRFVTRSPYTTYQGNCDFLTGLCAHNTAWVHEDNQTLTADWQIAEKLSLKSISAYESYDSETVTLTGGAPPPINYLDQHVRHQQYSEELNLSGSQPNLGGGLDWTIGAYYLNSHSLTTGTVDIPIVTAFTENDHAGDENKSAFVHAIYNFDPAVSLELGYRYTDERRSLSLEHDPFYGPVPGILTNPSYFDFGRGDYRASLNYRLVPDVLLYASVSTGFKAGGINPQPILPSQQIPFGPEKVTAYEVGMKSEWLQHRARLNVALYDNVYKNKQEFLSGSTAAGVPISEVVNINARIKGAEAELTLRPTQALQFDAALGYTDVRYTYINPDLLAQDLGGGQHLSMDDTSPYVPKVTASAGAQYTLDWDHGSSLTPRIDYTYRSRIYTDLQNSPDIALGGLGLWNASVTFVPSDSAHWRLVGRVRNLTDHFYYSSTTGNFRTSFGMLDAVPARPRTFDLMLRYDFR
ncbi:MAG: TonB-dependent receptor-like protein [Gammaproteobacteria bacterium]|nr:TonB-dependent receptor-like protein [Gammaproteobacteria bacterium]